MTATPLFIRRWGTGPTVVFLHGIGASSRYWESVRDVARDRFAMLAPDLLGFGESPKPDDATYDVDCHLALIEPLVVPGSVVVAHSTGAILACALAARRPDLVKGLLLLGLPAYPSRDVAIHDIEALGWLSKETVEETHAARAISWTEEHLEPLLERVARCAAGRKTVPPDVAADVLAHTWISYSRTLQHVVIDGHAATDLAGATCPARLLHGRDDADAPVAYVRDLARRCGSRVRLRVVRGDHHLALRRPRLVANAISRALPAHGPDQGGSKP